MNLMYIMSVPLLKKLKSSNFHLVLPHLYDTVPGYLKIYKEFSKKGDFIMQDNSLFELKKVVAGDLIDFAERVGASEVVVPEVLRDAEGSMEVVKEFLASEPYRKNKDKYSWALVLQGKTYLEIKKHYEYAWWLRFNKMINTICIPFNFEFDAYGTYDEEKKQSGWNRFSIIHRLMIDRVWALDGHHHLLGLFNPAELVMYKNVPRIRSNDSSSCFWHSLYGVHYTFEEGLLYRKIETHVDFNQDYQYERQRDIFGFNKIVSERYAEGLHGESLKKLYLKYARGYSLRLKHLVRKLIY